MRGICSGQRSNPSVWCNMFVYDLEVIYEHQSADHPYTAFAGGESRSDGHPSGTVARLDYETGAIGLD